MAYDINALKQQIKEQEAGSVSEGFKPLSSAPYEAIITKFGIYENNFGNESMHVEIEIKTENRPEPITLKSDRGLTLKDGSPNTGTLSMMKEIFAATKVDIDSAQTSTTNIKAFNKDVVLNEFKDTYNKTITALIREVLDKNNTAFPKSNIIEGIYNIDGKNSADEDQIETFMNKIKETPVLVKAQRATTNTTATGATASAAAAGRL